MSRYDDARLEWLLARHPDVVVGKGRYGTALYRRDQLLVLAHQADRAQQSAARWVERREDLLEIGVTRLHLRASASVDVGELAAALRNHSDGPVTATPNHLYRGEPDYFGGPFGTPVPTSPVPRPTSSQAAGRRAIVGIVDTGITPHPWFAGTDWFAQVTPDQIDSAHFEPDYALESQYGHGTFTAGVVLRQCPDAFLMIERALSDDGICDELQLLYSLTRLDRRVRESGEALDVLNLSLGGYTLDDQAPVLISDRLARFGKRTAVVAAAGNHGSQRPFWPAALKNCVGVGALDAKGERRSEFSNYGWWVDASAVGTDVIGPVPMDLPGTHGFVRWSGTSFATASVSGAIAAYASAKNMTVAEAVELLLDPAIRPRQADFGVVVEGPPTAPGEIVTPEPVLDTRSNTGLLIDPARSGRQPEVWVVDDAPVRRGRVVTIGFGFSDKMITDELPSWWSEEPPLPGPVRLRVLLKATGASIEPTAQRCVMRPDRTTEPLFFAVTPDDEVVSLTFSVYLERDGQLLQEVVTEIEVESTGTSGTAS